MKNPTTALLHSGGRNSIVLQHILEPWLDEILIIWINTGAAYESTLKQMHTLRDSVPHFFEINTDQPADIERWGLPSDIVPTRLDSTRSSRYRKDGFKLQPFTECCAKNITIPAEICLTEKGIETCYLGARGDIPATTMGMVNLKFPLAHWTADMLQEYVKKHNITLPPYYHQGEEKSRECWNCTAYLWQRRAAIRNLPFYQREEVMAKIQQIANAVHEEQAVGHGELLQDV